MSTRRTPPSRSRFAPATRFCHYPGGGELEADDLGCASFEGVTQGWPIASALGNANRAAEGRMIGLAAPRPPIGRRFSASHSCPPPLKRRATQSKWEFPISLTLPPSPSEGECSGGVAAADIESTWQSGLGGRCRRPRRRRRKVRTGQGTVMANGHRERSSGKCHRKHTADGRRLRCHRQG